ncbi:L,D-transpeptidase family protein [Roseicyclus sp. F158]|uniref:L,D-transpeptidase family protein n=1 Tax=Tropicimonas omnivorans TaxID=3075590 RepID=A0ABU3DJJ3_9RHOB|nr:L,D-transpeptidase family protein [Roseicyclus sp. F158]MDT0683743.1 L,D-transpeptidase family protein [Roseicyclus sp. F158]
MNAARRTLSAICLAAATFGALPAEAQISAFRQSVAERALGADAVGEAYRKRDYAPIFTGREDGARRQALLSALSKAGAHGLPTSRYDPDELIAAFRSVKSDRDRGRAEMMAARMLVDFGRDISSGALEPGKVVPGIKREIARPDAAEMLEAFAATGDPDAFLAGLAPRTPEYTRLMAEAQRLVRLIASGGWGPAVEGEKLEAGQSDGRVVALRNRLIRMGYLERTASPEYDAALVSAVQQFQRDHGIATDGVAGPSTLAALNVSPEQRLAQVTVAMERERWLPQDRGERHILVNITDFTARILDDGKVTFETRSVVGANNSDRQTPEFSDVMDHMVINPTWYIPRSITTKEYLPMMKRNPNAVSHLDVVDSRGRTVPRSAINFAAYSQSSFPFSMRQPPSQNNALGLVKFMFPNRYNIYLHDTPSKSLFDREKRAFSHGCVRLSDPFDFAYALLAKQSDDPRGLFQSHLRTGAETRVNLDAPVPVHLIYRTAVSQPKGRMSYRGDVYGRDAELWEALRAAGVEVTAGRG